MGPLRFRTRETYDRAAVSLRAGGGLGGNSTERADVLVVDDDAGFRTLVCGLLDEGGYATREAGSGSEAMSQVRSRQPGLLVLDVSLPGVSGYEVCHELRETFGDVFPILLVSGERIESLDRATGLMVGADDYLVKPFSPDEFLARVRRLLRGARIVPDADSFGLTQREREVIDLLADGLGSAQVAARLGISEKTANTHIGHLYAKLSARNRAHAVAIAYRHGLVRGSSQ